MDQPERVRYFDQQFLRVEDFTNEQDYHRDMRRRHNRMMHTPGIADGLLLVADGTGVKVLPGSAVPAGTDVNGGGAEIVLATERRQELSSFAANADVYVTIAFAQEETRFRDDAGVKGNTRWRENPLIEAFTSDPTATAPSNPTQPLRVLLGRVSRGGAGGKQVVAIDGSGRRLAGAAQSEVSLTPRDPSVTEPDWVRLRWSARGQAELRGSLRIQPGGPTAGDLTVAGAASVAGQVRGSALRIDGGGPDDTAVQIKPGSVELHYRGSPSTMDVRLHPEAPGYLSVAAAHTQLYGMLTVGVPAARARTTLNGDLVINRSLILAGRVDKSTATGGEVVGGIGFYGYGIQHGQLSFRPGSGFELVDRSTDGPSLTYAAGQYPYADLRVRNLHAIGGAIRPAAGHTANAGIQFPADPGGGAGDEAFIRYFAETGEITKLMIGVGNDLDDRMSFWQAGAERMVLYNGNLGVGTGTAEQKVHVIGNVLAGTAMIGDVGHGATWAGFSHYEARGPASYGFLHSSDGRWALINKRSGGGNVELRVDNVTRMWMNDAGDVQIHGRLGTGGQSPAPRTGGWGGGIHTWDVEAEGTMWSRGGYQSGHRDVAENFDCEGGLEPGDVVVLDPDSDRVVACRQAGDPLVLGVVSEAPAVLLGVDDGDETVAPVGLAGRVPCKVTTANGAIARGDLLTASDEPGHAMRAPARSAPGTVIGKALEPCVEETGIIDIVVMSR